MGQTVAQHLVSTLAGEGVKRIYGVVGDSLNPIMDAIRADGRIRFLHVRNEEAAAFAASADAQSTGDLAVCVGSCGPGNLHLINGLYDAHRSGAPVLAIASHIPSYEIGMGYFQETHPDRLFQECSHFCEMANSARHAPRVLRSAIQHAVGKGGVGVIVLPGDITHEPIPKESTTSPIARPKPVTLPNDAELHDLIERIERAERICIFGGIGASAAHDEVVALATKLKAPVGHSSRGKPFLEHDNPFDVGMSGLIGFGGLQHALEACDLLLMLGTDFPYTDFLPKETPIVQIDRRAEVLGRRANIALGLVGDIAPTLRAILPRLEERKNAEFFEECRSTGARSVDRVGEYVHHVDPDRPVHPELLAAALDAAAPDDAIFTADTGLNNVWMARYLSTRGGRRELHASWVHGSMANALPHAIGLQAAHPNRPVIAMCGDGGLAMGMGELLTLAQERLPVKVVVFDNRSLGFVKLEMQVAGLREFGTDLKNPDFGRVAEACGFQGESISKPDELKGALERLLTSSGPALLSVATDPNAISLPPKITLAQARGFAMAGMKMILAGEGSEVLETARSNYRLGLA